MDITTYPKIADCGTLNSDIKEISDYQTLSHGIHSREKIQNLGITNSKGQEEIGAEAGLKCPACVEWHRKRPHQFHDVTASLSWRGRKFMAGKITPPVFA